MNRNHRPSLSGWTIVLLSAAVLALGGCGRKGPLDLPPGTPPEAAAAAQADADTSPPRQQTDVFNPSYGSRRGRRQLPKARSGLSFSIHC